MSLINDLAEQLHHGRVIRLAGVARIAGIGERVVGNLVEVVLGDGLAHRRNLNVGRKLLHRIYGGIPSVFTPMAVATSARRSATTGLLNSMAWGSSMAQATPCGVS